MSGEIGKIFGSTFKTFTPDNILEQMIDSQEGTVFVLGTRYVDNGDCETEDDTEVEIIFAQIKKVRSK